MAHLSRSQIYAFYDRLPLVPLQEALRHFKGIELFYHCHHSKHVRNAMATARPRCRASVEIWIYKEYMEFFVKNIKDGSAPYLVSFKESRNSRPDSRCGLWQPRAVNARLRRASPEHPCLGTYPRVCSFQAENFSAFKNVVPYVMELLGQMYTIKYPLIRMYDKPRDTDFASYFLSLLPRGECSFLELFESQSPMDFEKFSCMWNRTLPHYVVDVRIPMKNIEISKQMKFIATNRIDFTDARFLSTAYMREMDFWYGDFGETSLTSADFNIYFRRWKEGVTINLLKYVKFGVKPGYIVQEDVVKDLDARFIKKDVWEVTDKKGKTATMYFSNSRLWFFNSRCSPIRQAELDEHRDDAIDPIV